MSNGKGCHTRPTDVEVEFSRGKWSETSEVHLCHSCKGRGYIVKERMTCYHRDEYDHTHHLCKTCEGHGRITTTTRLVQGQIITTSPYTLNREELD